MVDTVTGRAHRWRQGRARAVLRRQRRRRAYLLLPADHRGHPVSLRSPGPGYGHPHPSTRLPTHHGVAVDLRGCPTPVVKRALGHSSMRMVERYVHFDAAGLANDESSVWACETGSSGHGDSYRKLEPTAASPRAGVSTAGVHVPARSSLGIADYTESRAGSLSLLT